MSPNASTPTAIDEFFNRFKDTLLQTWKETGFGHIEIDSERISQNKIRVILRGSTHYRYVISDEEVERCTPSESQKILSRLPDKS